MGRADTGLSNNTPNENEVSPNRDLDHPMPEDSDSDFDENEDRLGDYMPLSQNPYDGEPLNGSSNESDDEIDFQENEMVDEAGPSNMELPKVTEIGTVLVEEDCGKLSQVWSKPTPKEVDIELTEKKIDLVKQVMSNIQLPTEAIPEWAKNIPEEEWKGHLLQRLNKNDT